MISTLLQYRYSQASICEGSWSTKYLHFLITVFYHTESLIHVVILLLCERNIKQLHSSLSRYKQKQKLNGTNLGLKCAKISLIWIALFFICHAMKRIFFFIECFLPFIKMIQALMVIHRVSLTYIWYIFLYLISIHKG